MVESADQQAIRDLIVRWCDATRDGDVEVVAGLMEEDCVFLVAGQPPMRGRATFVEGLRTILRTHRIEATPDIQEVMIDGDLAYSWNVLAVSMRPLGGGPGMNSVGNILTVYRRGSDGRWRLWRDANLLPAPAG